jgi:outer membrane lipoprotein-sorting protein
MGATPRHMGGMQRRALLRLFPALLMLPAVAPAQPRFEPTSQDRADLARIETYLDGLRTMKAHFLQVAPNGAISRGTVWLDRPGRMRFQYDPPSPLLLVAGHGLVVFHDKSLNQTTNIPIGQTPLGILLADHVRLGGDVTVTGMQHLPGQVQVSLVRTASPGDGTLTLIFADNPLALRQWTVTDAQRQQTTVTLYNVEMGGQFDQKLFQFIDPRALQPGTNG